jgi:nicotinate phosphoribosyltransferase
MAIKSILDNDLYKFTMQQAVLKLFPNANVVYKFKNRGNEIFDGKLVMDLLYELFLVKETALSDNEESYLRSIPFFEPWYIEYLKNYKFNLDQVKVKIKDNKLDELSIEGPWHSTILWEVPILYSLSFVYFKNKCLDKNEFAETCRVKMEQLDSLNIKFADFGTRRRASYLSQATLINIARKYKNSFIGTSNVHFANMYNLKAIGTMAHEWIMGNSGLNSLRHANKFAMDNWINVYNGNLGIALTDTFGTDVFLNDFDLKNAKLFDGVRHDSGDPLIFTNKIVDFYTKLGINTNDKTIVFSDGISSIQQIKTIKNYCDYKKIKCSFGIGTWLTNDFKNTTPLNIVIKLDSINNIPVVKLSDDEGKETGNSKALNIAKWTFQKLNKNKLCEKCLLYDYYDGFCKHKDDIKLNNCNYFKPEE